jgi:hypothetical protein
MPRQRSYVPKTMNFPYVDERRKQIWSKYMSWHLDYSSALNMATKAKHVFYFAAPTVSYTRWCLTLQITLVLKKVKKTSCRYVYWCDVKHLLNNNANSDKEVGPPAAEKRKPSGNKQASFLRSLMGRFSTIVHTYGNTKFMCGWW